MPIDKESFTLDNLRPIFSMVIVMWVVQFGNWFLDYELNQWFGIAPRQLEGLMGVPLSPFLHANWSHILANTVPLLMLGGMAAMVAPTRFFDATLIIILLGGLMVWLMARGGLRVHVGASGLIFGYLGFVVALGVMGISSFWCCCGYCGGLYIAQKCAAQAQYPLEEALRHGAGHGAGAWEHGQGTRSHRLLMRSRQSRC